MFWRVYCLSHSCSEAPRQGFHSGEDKGAEVLTTYVVELGFEISLSDSLSATLCQKLECLTVFVAQENNLIGLNLTYNVSVAL